MNNNVSVLFLLTKELGVPVTKKTISDELLKHPNLYSLLAYSDVLNYLKISNAAYNVKFDDLFDIHCPFIACLSNREFVLVNEINRDNVVVSDERWNKYLISVEKFKEIYSGSILIAEKNENSGEPNFISKHRNERIDTFRNPICFLFLFFLSIFLIQHQARSLNGFNVPIVLLLISKTMGLITSALLLVQSIDANNPLIRKICGIGKNSNCNAILSSKAAKVFEGLSWSEVGFFYFSGTWLLLIFFGNSIPIFSILFVLNIISLPYTVYSIYYQAQVAKQWCALCCTIQALLWIEFIILMSDTTRLNFSSISGNREFLTDIFICLSTPIIFWLLLKPLFLKNQELQSFKEQLRKLKYNENLFGNVLKMQPKFVQPDDSWSIVFGNIEGSRCITMVSDPYCSPCAHTHKVLDQLLTANPNIQARIVFWANNLEEDIRTEICRHLVALNALPDKQIIKNALHDWYNQKQKNYESWAKSYPVKIEDFCSDTIDKQIAWCRSGDIKSTPTLIVDGYLLPEIYQLTDLKYMLG